jgi:hypothetical protein
MAAGTSKGIPAIYLHQSASSTGMEYHHTYVDWASYEFVFSTYKDIVFDGDVEIDNACSVEKLIRGALQK